MLNWTAPTSGATSYNVKRGTSLSGAFTTIATLHSAVTYTDSGTNYDGSNILTNGTKYYYVVTAMNNIGESGASNTVGATPNKSSITNIFNTGIDSSGNAVADSNVDPHYALVSTPSGSAGTAYVTQQHWPIQNGVWLLDTSTSKWVSPYADESQQLDAPGNYTYQTTFTVTGDATAVKITGQLAADNQVTAIILNGVTVASNLVSSYNAWTSFSLTSGFVTGTNTLQFVVYNASNSPNPSGFRCEMTGALK